MGGGNWTDMDWTKFITTATVDPATGRTKARHEIFATGLKAAFDPAKITIREACDSEEHPYSTPIIVGLDVTGSMGMIPEKLVTGGLKDMIGEVYNRKPVSDPQLMFAAIGDVYSDSAPLQVTQFESDIRIAEQLKDLWLEGGGGGNMEESYNLLWYFAAMKTDIQCFSRRGKKGYLFTVGDERVPEGLSVTQIRQIFRDTAQADIKTEDLLRMVQERYEVFHLMITQGSNFLKGNTDAQWKGLLGERAIPLSDYTKVPEVIVSTLEVMAGRDVDAVAGSWSGSTALVVRNALAGMSGRALARKGTTGKGVWRPNTL